MPKPHAVRLSVTLPPAVAERLRAESVATGLKVSTLVNKAVMGLFSGATKGRAAPTPLAGREPHGHITPNCTGKAKMPNAEFDGRLEKFRMTEPVAQAARLVLVAGYTQAQAARECGVGHRQDVYRAVRKIVANKMQ
jgi:predicted DNA-binding protein (UPF0251 family)